MKVFTTKKDENIVRRFFLIMLFGILYITFLSFLKSLNKYGIISKGLIILIITIPIFYSKYLSEKINKSKFYEKFLNRIPILLLLVIDILGLIFVNSKINL